MCLLLPCSGWRNGVTSSAYASVVVCARARQAYPTELVQWPWTGLSIRSRANIGMLARVRSSLTRSPM